MTTTLRATSALTGLSLHLLASGALAATPGGTPPAPDQPAPISSATLLSLYLAANPGLKTDPGFARDWTAVTRCAAWSPIARDEFRAAPFLRAGAADLAATRDVAPQAFELRLDRQIDRYDEGRREFGLRTLGPDDMLPVRINGYYGGDRPSTFNFGCDPTGGEYPVAFEVGFDNSDVANGLPMAPDAAAAFAQARTNQFGTRNTLVTVDLKVRLTLGMPHPVDPSHVVKGVVVPVSAHIEDVTVDDGTPQHRVIYHLDPAKRQAGNDAAAEARRRVRAEAAVKPLDAATLVAQFEMERAGPKVGPEPSAIGLSTYWSRGDAPGDQSYRFRLKPTDAFTVGGAGVAVRFDNTAEVAELAPTPDMAAIVAGNVNWGVSVTYVPVGASDDRQKGGRTVVGHILSVDTVDGSKPGRHVLSVRTASAAAPWTETVDARTAASFDVLGIKVGMGVDEVTSLGEAALGQKFAYDQARGQLRSPLDQCDFDIPRRGPAPPLGKRCLTATFARVSAAGQWALVRLRLKQSAAASQQGAVQKALTAKYGDPDLIRQFAPPASLSDMEGEDRPPAAAAGWGARLSDRRAEPDGVPMPLHALEAITLTDRGQLTTTLTLTDGAAVAAAADAETAAKKAADAVPTKF